MLHLLYLQGVTEKEFITIGFQTEQQWAFEVRACIFFRTLLPENGVNWLLLEVQISQKGNFLRAMKFDMICRTLGAMSKLNSDPCQANLLLPAHS